MQRAVRSMAKLQSALGGLLLFACLWLIIVQIVLGYMGMNASWAKKASLCAMIWGVFIESGALVYEKRHFAFGGLSGRIKSRRALAIWDLGLSLFKLIFAVLLVAFGLQLSKTTGEEGMAGLLGFGFLWLCLPVCGATSAVYLLCHMADALGRLRGGEGR